MGMIRSKYGGFTGQIDHEMISEHHNHHMMGMTFSSVYDYRLKLLFEAWNIQEVWQYALAWVGVMMGVVCFHAIKSSIIDLEEYIDRVKEAYGYSPHPVMIKRNHQSVVERFLPPKMAILRIFHSLFSALNYAVSPLKMNLFITR